MGIGTSLGAYFETDFDHHAGNDAMNQDDTPIPVANVIGTPKGALYEGQFHRAMGENPNGLIWQRREGEYVPYSFPDNMELSTNEVMSKSYEEPKIIPIADIKTASPLVTITDADIDKGIGLALSFSGGGLSTTGKVIPMRKAANDNKDLAINSQAQEAFINNMRDDWKAFADKYKRGSDIIQQRDTLMDKLRDSGLNDIEKQKLKNLDKQHTEHFGGKYPD